MLYNDRVFAYETMVSIDPILDSANDEQVSTFVDADSRNHIAHLELLHYQQHKAFLYLHPLLLKHKQTNQLRILLSTKPAMFMKDIVNITNNISRYSSWLNNNKYKTIEEQQTWLNIVAECNATLIIMQQLITK